MSRTAETILLVEHDPSVLNTLVQILTLQGYHVLQARTPKAALEIANRRDYEPALLLTGVTLPGLYGWQLAECLKLPYPNLQVLYISDECDDHTEELGDPSESTLHKPFQSDELQRIVRKILDNRSFRVASANDRSNP